jgi:rhamnosyl/mannosyltransferase
MPPTQSGMARVGDKLTAGFRERGHSVDVLASEHLPRVRFRDVRIPITPPYLPKIRARAANADIVSLHGPVPAFSDLLLLFAGTFGTPPVAYSHHMDVRFRIGKAVTDAYARLYRRLMSRASVNIVATHATGGSITGAASARTHVVPYGVDHDRVRDDIMKSRDFTLLFVGQLRPYKGVEVLLRAMTLLSGVRLKVVGRGYEERRYRRIAAELGLGNVEFLGAVSDDDLWRLYAESHIFVLPSTEMEYFGLATLEAMASGCVPVVADLPGPRELVGDTGRIVARYDHCALAEAIAGLRDDPSNGSRLSDAARKRAAGFTWENCIERYLNLYEKAAR